jgi:predicted phosphodiesterase
LIAAENFKADVLLCCGDLADKAEPGAMKYAWSFLDDVASQLGAKLCATAGNHDVDSRYGYNDFDARGMLQNLLPNFPVRDSPLADQYWARHFCVVELGHLRLILLNSAAYHGQGSTDAQPPEYSRGRIAKSTVERLKDALQVNTKATVNLLAVHHHPMAIAGVDEDGSQMVNGEALVDLLAMDHHTWMIIHGHKHVPRLVHGQGGNNAPLIFGCGSFAALPTGKWATNTPNQFYLVEYPSSPGSAGGLPLAGRFRSWDWHIGMGWEPAADLSGLPSAGGFGCREHSTSVAANVAALVRARSPVALTWQEVLDQYPQYAYLAPTDVARVRRDLEKTNSVHVQWGPGYPTELST